LALLPPILCLDSKKETKEEIKEEGGDANPREGKHFPGMMTDFPLGLNSLNWATVGSVIPARWETINRRITV
jgi:hypothetical protein